MMNLGRPTYDLPDLDPVLVVEDTLADGTPIHQKVDVGLEAAMVRARQAQGLPCPIESVFPPPQVKATP